MITNRRRRQAHRLPAKRNFKSDVRFGPSITGVDPASGPVGTLVTISGPVRAGGYDPGLQIDANAARPWYPLYAVDVGLTAGQTTVLPTLRITPPPPAERFIPIDNAAQDQVVADARDPGLALTLPAGVTIVGWDGQVTR